MVGRLLGLSDESIGILKMIRRDNPKQGEKFTNLMLNHKDLWISLGLWSVKGHMHGQRVTIYCNNNNIDKIVNLLDKSNLIIDGLDLHKKGLPLSNTFSNPSIWFTLTNLK